MEPLLKKNKIALFSNKKFPRELSKTANMKQVNNFHRQFVNLILIIFNDYPHITVPCGLKN